MWCLRHYSVAESTTGCVNAQKESVEFGARTVAHECWMLGPGVRRPGYRSPLSMGTHGLTPHRSSVMEIADAIFQLGHTNCNMLQIQGSIVSGENRSPPGSCDTDAQAIL